MSFEGGEQLIAEDGGVGGIGVELLEGDVVDEGCSAGDGEGDINGAVSDAGGLAGGAG